jgi:23S rRNA pseudouridine1911/1915/1917 synthase
MSIVLFEDNHLLVVNKPAGLPTMGVTSNKPSLFEQSRRYIKDKYHKPGNVYLGVVSRLDGVATGVLVFARTSKAAARLTEQFRSGEVEKTYWAIVAPPPEQQAAEWIDYLRKDERQQKMVVVNSAAKGAQEARLRYAIQRPLAQLAWLQVQLETGRKHQIRVQLAHLDHPIAGDDKYGDFELNRMISKQRMKRMFLHASQLAFEHPVTAARIELSALLPDELQAFLDRLELSRASSAARPMPGA